MMKQIDPCPIKWKYPYKADPMKLKNIYTIIEAAELLHCHCNTLRKEIKAGKLKAARVGRDIRISRTELERYFKTKGGGELF